MTFGDGVTNWLCEIQEMSFGFKNATRASINIIRDAFWVSYSFQVPSVSYQFVALGESQFLVWKKTKQKNPKNLRHLTFLKMLMVSENLFPPLYKQGLNIAGF